MKTSMIRIRLSIAYAAAAMIVNPGCSDEFTDHRRSNDGTSDTSEPSADGEGNIEVNSAGKPVVPNQPTKVWGPDPAGTEEYTILDFDESNELQDTKWLSKQPGKKIYTYVTPKGDSGNDNLYLGIGEGRNGSNALVVESTTAKMGVPGFWVLRNGLGGNATNADGYLLPKGKRANRLEFWLKFDKGFRQSSSSSPVINYPNHENLHVGTYNFDPALIGKAAVKESNNWHFYHQIYLRHDKAQDEWIKVVINEAPQHQRGTKGQPGINPTAPFGNYYEIMTRIYVDLSPYFDDPEIAYPVKMYVDDIKLKYIPPTKDIVVAFDDYHRGSGFTTTPNTANSVPFTITNNETTPEELRIRSYMQDSLGDVGIVDASKNPVSAFVTIPPRSSLKLFLQFKAKAKIKRQVGVAAVLRSEIKSDSTSVMRSIADDNVELRWNNGGGPTDADVKSTFLNVISQ